MCHEDGVCGNTGLQGSSQVREEEVVGGRPEGREA